KGLLFSATLTETTRRSVPGGGQLRPPATVPITPRMTHSTAAVSRPEKIAAPRPLKTSDTAATPRAPSSAGAPANFHGYCAAQRLARRSPFLPSSATAPPIRVKKKTPAASPELTENELNRKKARPPAAPPPRAAPHGHII